MSRSKNILITGGSGWLGQFVHHALTNQEANTDIHITYNSIVPDWISSDKCHKVDFTSRDEITTCIESFKPDIVIHLAALSSPVACEKDPEKAMQVNRPLLFLETILRINPAVLFLFTSTDLVYDGENAPYNVDTVPPVPCTTYGKTKSAFEQDVLKLENGVILRLSNMIGPKYQYQKVGGKFLQFLTEMHASRDYIGLMHDQIRSFVSVRDVSKLICKIIESYLFTSSLPLEMKGIFNVGGPAGVSRLQLAQELCDHLGTNLDVHQTKLDDFEKSADANTWSVYKSSNLCVVIIPGVENPRDVTMNSLKTEEVFGIRFLSTREAIPELL